MKFISNLLLKFLGILISFLILILTVLIIIIYYELTEEHATRFKDFQVSEILLNRYCHIVISFKEMTGLEIELNDIRSILMNEFILEAWKREKHRRERQI
jgi:hypothetical protein